MILKLASGFQFDYTHLFGPGKVTAADLATLDECLANAHHAVERIRETGAAAGHDDPVRFMQLPDLAVGKINSVESVDQLIAFGESQRYHADAVVHLGIGGSYLGNRVLLTLHGGETWNSRSVERRDGYPKLFFGGYSIDPRQTSDLIDQLSAEARQKSQAPYRIVLVVASKSGTTPDTMASFLVVYEALSRLRPAVELSVVAVTDPEETRPTLLKQLAMTHGWRTFAVPAGVGGRFSVFSEVGLITGACIGFDLRAFLAGARTMDEACQTDRIMDNPAMLNAALKYLAATRYGQDIEVFMPYADCLKPVAEWYVQLLAESLGKRNSRNGETVYYGRTPVVAVGTTDMHAQTQQHQDGKRDKVVQFIQVETWAADPVIPGLFPGTRLDSMAGIRMSQALAAALRSNAAALAKDGRPSATVIMPRLDAFHLGELLYWLALSVAYEGELADVNAYDQPGVEAYKKIMADQLAKLKP